MKKDTAELVFARGTPLHNWRESQIREPDALATIWYHIVIFLACGCCGIAPMLVPAAVPSPAILDNNSSVEGHVVSSALLNYQCTYDRRR